MTRTVVERRDVQDSEGSRPFKANTQVLVLGDDPLVLGSLTISAPVIWYSGGYSSTALVAIKPWDSHGRGPIAACTATDVVYTLDTGQELRGDRDGTGGAASTRATGATVGWAVVPAGAGLPVVDQ